MDYVTNPGAWIGAAALLIIVVGFVVLAIIERRRLTNAPPVEHYLNRHDNCSPRKCLAAADLCNDAEFRNRAEEETWESCPNCGERHTYQSPSSPTGRFCTVCGHEWDPVPQGQDWWDG